MFKNSLPISNRFESNIQIEQFQNNSFTFKRCLPRGGCNLPKVVSKRFSAEETSNSLSKSPAQ